MLELYNITMPSASNAATQATRTVTATFIQNKHPDAKLRSPGVRTVQERQAVGFEAVVVGVGEVGAGDALRDGSFSFCPTRILSLARLLSDRSVFTDVLCCVAIFESVSPDFTV